MVMRLAVSVVPLLFSERLTTWSSRARDSTWNLCTLHIALSLGDWSLMCLYALKTEHQVAS